ncbi:class I lanthipeptide [Kordia sp.]|uniref:class I lanthipeptide n=1 Tax=Kordia sp. TaxID=1965332 RepID=UPI0025BD2584|nr:class I lanthipeptide [Kordia sp.]MCH2192871.1 class I lanthipeptide [Kordia sp.]
MKKKSLKNLSLNKKSISNLHASQGIVGGTQNSIKICIRTIVDQNGNNLCLRTVFNCDRTWQQGCVNTNEVDTNTYPIC